jgi:hypothetical protein
VDSLYPDFSKDFDREGDQLLLKEISRSMLMAKILFDRKNTKDKNLRRCFQGYQGDRDPLGSLCLSTEYR